MTAERRGTPAVAVITDRFVDTANLMAEVCGMPGYRFAVVGHPFASDTREQLQRKAEEAVRQAPRSPHPAPTGVTPDQPSSGSPWRARRLP